MTHVDPGARGEQEKTTKAAAIAYRRSAARDGRLARTWIDLGNPSEAAYHARHSAHAAFLLRPDLREAR